MDRSVALLCLTLLLISRVSFASKPSIDVNRIPIFREFDGKTFVFRGGVRDLLFHSKRRLRPRSREVACASCKHGRFYNLLSEDDFRVTTLFSEITFADASNGTFVKGAGMADKGASFTVETLADFTDDLTVTLNGRHIELEGATKIHKVKGAGGVMATLTLGRNIAGYGTAVNFTTPTASLFAYLVPSGLDTVGFLQPSYLNFDLTLLKIPSRRIEGLMVMDTYRLASMELQGLLPGRLRGQHDEQLGPPRFCVRADRLLCKREYKAVARVPKAATHAIISLTKHASRLEIPPVPLDCEFDRVTAMGEIPCAEPPSEQQ